jgi:hypothetical protein
MRCEYCKDGDFLGQGKHGGEYFLWWLQICKIFECPNASIHTHLPKELSPTEFEYLCVMRYDVHYGCCNSPLIHMM